MDAEWTGSGVRDSAEDTGAWDVVACREGNWVLCNNHHGFLWSQQWNLEALPWRCGGHSEQQCAESLSFGALESARSPRFAYIALIPCLQTVLVALGTPRHGTRPGLLHLTKLNSWSGCFVVFYDKWNAKFSVLAFSHGPLTHVVGLFREQDKPGCRPRVCSSFRCPSKG